MNIGKIIEKTKHIGALFKIGYDELDPNVNLISLIRLNDSRRVAKAKLP